MSAESATPNFSEMMDKTLPTLGPVTEENNNKPDPDEDKNKNPNPEDRNEEEDEDDDEPDFKTKEKKKEVKSDKKEESKKGREESIADLRKARDEAIGQSKKYKEVFGDTDVSLFKPLIDTIQEQVDGPLTPEAVSEIIEGYKSKDARIAELEEQLQNQDRTITDLDVRHSPEFKKKYENPYREAGENLFIEFANLNENKEILGPNATKAFHDFLTSKVDELDATSVKAELVKFSKAYEAETGEKPELPTISSLMTSIRHFREKRDDMREAYSNWKETKEKTKLSQQAEEEKNREFLTKKNKRERKNLATKAYQSFNHDDLEGLVNDDEVTGLFQSEYKKGEDIFDGKEVPSFDFMIQRGVKSELFDKMLPELKRLKALEKEWEEKEREGISGAGNRPAKTQTKQEGWAAI